jgi:DMSO/TMAO reductase YedYZ molybdopterin-dependent catalytic subunit
VARLIARRKLLLGLAASVTLAECDTRAASMFLAGMGRWNERVDRLLFSQNRLAPEPPASELTPEAAFPSYFVSDTMPCTPADWAVKIGGLVARPAVYSLDQLKRMPQTGMRIRHHCVEQLASSRG